MVDELGVFTQTRGFGGPQSPKVPAQPAPLPKEEDPAVQNAAAEAARRRRTARGFRSTILSTMVDQGGSQLKDTLGT